MQNRNMFPFRRQGPKKRNKSNNARKIRGPQKGLPNNARDLLSILQSATKALAQMLAGRTNPSGQLNHAQSVLGQAERLISERAHNRLNPAEREEFFEQLARLKLTLADAEVEAEVVAAEEQEPKRQAPPVDQERLRAMALALSRPEPAPADTEADRRQRMNGGPGHQVVPGNPADAAPAPATEPAPEERDQEPAAATPRSEANARSGRLQLSRPASEQAGDALEVGLGVENVPRIRRTRARPAPARGGARQAASEEGTGRPEEALATPAVAAEPEEAGPPAAAEQVAAAALPDVPGQVEHETAPDRAAQAEMAESAGPATDGGAEPAEQAAEAPEAESQRPRRTRRSPSGTAASRRTRRTKNKGLPEGWVIDDEGFVVPGPS